MVVGITNCERHSWCVRIWEYISSIELRPLDKYIIIVEVVPRSLLKHMEDIP